MKLCTAWHRLMIGLRPIGFQPIPRAAMANPVNSLRSE
jgi:hypothetical protein